jgi:hypothetical protein
MIRSVVLVLCCLAGSVAAAEPALRVVTEKGNRRVAVEAVGLTADQLAALTRSAEGDSIWGKTLGVFVVDKAAEDDPPAMLGAYSVADGKLRFTPRYGFRPGLEYKAVLRPSGAAAVTLAISVPAPPRRAPARIVGVYPSAAVLPENQLRFYLHFSAPMSRGEAYANLALLKEDGKAVEHPFLEIGEELWDPSGRRLTLLIDPGRIKRGLQPRELFGPVLEAGRTYTLVIKRTWRDESGQPLGQTSQKKFTAGPPAEKALDHRDWKITSPPAGSRERLVVQFPSPLDRALAARLISVADPGGKPLAGEVSLGAEERQWDFRPDLPWAAGRHELVVDTALEDGAGNQIGRPFEVDQFQKIERQARDEMVRLPFEIRAGGQ